MNPVSDLRNARIGDVVIVDPYVRLESMLTNRQRQLWWQSAVFDNIRSANACVWVVDANTSSSSAAMEELRRANPAESDLYLMVHHDDPEFHKTYPTGVVALAFSRSGVARLLRRLNEKLPVRRIPEACLEQHLTVLLQKKWISGGSSSGSDGGQ